MSARWTVRTRRPGGAGRTVCSSSHVLSKGISFALPVSRAVRADLQFPHRPAGHHHREVLGGQEDHQANQWGQVVHRGRAPRLAQDGLDSLVDPGDRGRR